MNLISEVRFSLRMLRKTPVVSAIVIATMALAIGANTAIFSLVYAILVRPLPLHQPENLAYIW